MAGNAIRGKVDQRQPGQFRQKKTLCLLMLMFSGILTIGIGAAEPLNKSIPPQSYHIPAGDLSQALTLYAGNAGVLLSFDSSLTQHKKTSGLKGSFGIMQGFSELLRGSGLEVVEVEGGRYQLRRATVLDSDRLPGEKSSIDFQQVDAVEVRAKRFYEIGPLPGLGLTKEEIPGNVQSITAKEIKEAHSLSLADLFNRKLQSVTVNDYQGNPFQMDVQYRGFTAGPQIGSPQGLSVFFDGIRVNEPFGDVVNWDMIPMNAIATVDVFPGSNPIFGLNTLGGAFTVKTKDGFNNTGFDTEILTGSYGRKQLQAEGGWNNGTIAGFAAANIFLEDGWRENSPSKVNQVFGKGSYRGDKLDLNLSTLVVWNDLTGNGVLPSEMYKQDRNSVFTSPDTTDNRLWQGQLSGSYFVNDNFTITGQIYRRNSKRRQRGADAFMGIDDDTLARRIPEAGEQYTCLFNSNNQFGLPDYVVITVDNYDPTIGNDLFSHPFILDYFTNGYADFSLGEENKELPEFYLKPFKEQFEIFRNFSETSIYNRDLEKNASPAQGPASEATFNEALYVATDWAVQRFPTAPGDNIYFSDQNFYFTNNNGVLQKNYVFLKAPVNNENCLATQDRNATFHEGKGAFSYFYPGTGVIQTVDGAGSGTPGVVEGTPTAIFTDNQINQVTDGASVQFNWNFEHHKFMLGASIDASDSEYSNEQRLGLLDANRKAYLAPDLIHPMFAGADIPISNNDFSGTNMTKSVYFSETWSPVKTWNFSISGRYNETRVKNTIAARHGIAAYEIGDVISYPDSYNICPNGDCTGVQTGYRLPRIANALEPAETEKFSYYSFNPSLGATWQATENLNIFVNLAQGTRTPSVIELGCALDRTPIKTGTDTNPIYVPKSIYENRSCTLPTTLSGDPYLPQIKATTYDIGVRGNLGNNLRWNVGAYQTDLKDDIYFVAIGNGRGFFDSIGDTRRRGIEAGLSGDFGKARFSLNYALTDATFEEDFLMFSEDNSSAVFVNGLGNGVINVKPGSRMPGVPLHNLNASLSYALTDKWTIGMSAVVHSESFVRGNENNEHRQGVARTFNSIRLVDDGSGNIVQEVYTRTLPPTTNPGKVAGYATFNLQTSYRFSSEWTMTVLINNLFDKEYYSAGRLGRNPFSPSITGAIGPDGYNHNSDDWRSTNFIAPGAPRGIWFSLRYEFDPRK